ncbi:MAG: DUF2970 domain-containing protein [Methylophilales bacterium]|nr:DUF2970 domain-containing protein [Methylophilales bacterium]
MQEIQKKPKASLFKVFKAVSWAFLGVREQRAYDEDITSITIPQAILVGLFSALLFVLCIVSVVMFVTR